MSELIPIVSRDDIPAAIEYASKHPSARWYTAKMMANVYGRGADIPDEWGEAIVAAHKPKLGTGTRFANLRGELAGRGVKDPGALAAWIGRKKFGKAKFAKLGAKARTAAVTADATDAGDAADGGATGLPTAEWLRAVRQAIADAGVDPDVIEATIGGGFATAYDEGTDPAGYAEQALSGWVQRLTEEFPQLLDTDDDEDGPVDEDAGEQPTQERADDSAPPVNMPAPPVAAAGNGHGGYPLVMFNGYPPQTQSAAQDQAGLVASLRDMIREEVHGAIVAAFPPDDEEDQDGEALIGGPGRRALLDEEPPGPPLDGPPPPPPGPPDAGPPPAEPPADESAAPPGPLDLGDAKDALRRRFGSAARKAPRPPVSARVASMRARVEARSGKADAPAG
jgi:hypothetical protein